MENVGNINGSLHVGSLPRYEKELFDVPDSGQVMVVDDDPNELVSIATFLRAYGLTVRLFEDGGKALAGFCENAPDVLLTDVHMPNCNGIKLMEQIRTMDTETPIILITADAELDEVLSAIKMKVFEFFIKPFHPEILLKAVAKGIRYKRLQQLEKNYRYELEKAVTRRTSELLRIMEVQQETDNEIIRRLTTASRLRDDDTGLHISRIGLYAGEISRALQMPDCFVETIAMASTMHDIGKIGIPDEILFKPGPLTENEFEIIKTHTLIGALILRGSFHPLLQMAATIALTHHERWDGSGYPQGLRGEKIPMEARIVMLADQYDALRSKRVYKTPLDHDAVCRIILEGDDQTIPEHFDPEILRAFRETSEAFAAIFENNQGAGNQGGEEVGSYRNILQIFTCRKEKV